MKIEARQSEQDMVWNWGRAESKSLRYSPCYAQMSQSLRGMLDRDQKSGLTAQDWGQLSTIVFQSRRPLLAGLRRLGTTWHSAILNISEVPSLNLMNWPPHVGLANSRLLRDFVVQLDAGHVHPAESAFLNGYRVMKAQFTVSKMNGLPILVSKSENAPFLMVEGYTRLSVLCSLIQDGDAPIESLQVLLGICPGMSGWYLNDNESQQCLY